MVAGTRSGDKRFNAGMDLIERAANRLHGLSEDLLEGAEQFRAQLIAAQEVTPGSQEDVFLRSIPFWEQKRSSYQEGYVHLLADLVADGLVMFYHRGKNMTPMRCICDAPVPYLHASEQGYDDFKREVRQAVPMDTSYLGMCITGSGIEQLFLDDQTMLRTASLLCEWSDLAPIHIDYDLASFRALDYGSQEKFPFSLLTPSVAEQTWHMKMMLERNHARGQAWTPDIEYHRVQHWQTVRDFPVGSRHDLATLCDEARFQLKMYPGLLEDVLRSLAHASVHAPG